MSENRKQEIKSVPGRPEKDFFISMLTRDIDMQDAILDLLDNCVDGAIRCRTSSMAELDSFQGYWAKITFDEHKFVIEDNCGGIPWEIAKRYAFCLGRPEGIAATKPGTIGVVGIGMKRAIFKMGRECHVHSNHSKDAFLVTIPSTWFKEADWHDFGAQREAASSKDFGTILEVTELTDDAKKDFKIGSTFRANFSIMVAESYSILIEKGFAVTVNGEAIKAKPVKLYFEKPQKTKTPKDLIRPYVFECTVGEVNVFVAVGYRSPLRTLKEQENDAVATFAAKEAGWTIVCNNRVVLSNDRSVKTGWGFGGVPNFHNQFSCIAGIVEFRSPNIANLPVTTTKRGVDAGKDIYSLIRQRMQEGLKCFTRNTNRWKGHEDELKHQFQGLKMFDLMELQSISKQLPMHKVTGDGTQRQFVPDLPEKRKVVTTRRICFVRAIKDIEKVSRYVFEDVRAPEEVGEACFERILREASK